MHGLDNNEIHKMMFAPPPPQSLDASYIEKTMVLDKNKLFDLRCGICVAYIIYPLITVSFISTEIT